VGSPKILRLKVLQDGFTMPFCLKQTESVNIAYIPLFLFNFDNDGVLNNHKTLKNIKLRLKILFLSCTFLTLHSYFGFLHLDLKKKMKKCILA